MNIYVSIAVEQGDDTASLEMMAKLKGLSFSKREHGPDGRQWLNLHGEISEEGLEAIAGHISN